MDFQIREPFGCSTIDDGKYPTYEYEQYQLSLTPLTFFSMGQVW